MPLTKKIKKMIKNAILISHLTDAKTYGSIIVGYVVKAGGGF
jgi:hypothetical protein